MNKSAPKIAIITAAHNGNAGMHSVDKAAIDLFSELNIPFQFYVAQAKTFFSFRNVPGFMKRLTPKPKTYIFEGKRVTLLRSTQQLNSYDVVVYWGDFLNNPIYGSNDFCSRDLRWGYSRTKQDAYHRWRSLFVDVSMGQSKVISAGNNFQHQFHEKRHIDAITALLTNFHTILPRDRISYQNLLRQSTNSQRCKVRQGLDLAFLQKPFDTERGRNFSYFFHRSKLNSPELIVKRIEQKVFQKGEPIMGWLSLAPDSAEASFARLRRQISESSFVLTDTYHVAVNAMSLGIPVFGLGRSSESQRGTLGDLKKKELFSMFKLEKNYWEFSDADTAFDLSERIGARIEGLLKADFKPLSASYQQIKRKTCEFKQEVTRLIF